MTCAPTERQSVYADADAYDDANDLGSFFPSSLACTHRGLETTNEKTVFPSSVQTRPTSHFLNSTRKSHQ